MSECKFCGQPAAQKNWKYCGRCLVLSEHKEHWLSPEVVEYIAEKFATDIALLEAEEQSGDFFEAPGVLRTEE